MSESEESHGGRRRIGIIVTIVIAVVAAVVAATVFLPPLFTSDEDQASGPHSTEAPTEPAPTETVPPRDIVDPDAPRPTQTPAPVETEAAFPELEPVEPDATISADEGIEISLSRLEAVQGEATAPGEISGPAIRATVHILNARADPIDLGYVVVNAYSGADRTPAATVTRPGGQPFEGSLASGESADGVYLFSIDEAARDDVTVTVDYLFGSEAAVFRGDLR